MSINYDLDPEAQIPSAPNVLSLICPQDVSRSPGLKMIDTNLQYFQFVYKPARSSRLDRAPETQKMYLDFIPLHH